MVFPPTQIPDPEDFGLDNGVAYVADTPQDIKDQQISSRRHRWFDVREIGTSFAAYTTTRGLNGGQDMRIQFDHKPDWIIVSISGETANTGRCRLYLGDPGGFGIPLGAGGQVVIPAPQNGIVTIRNVGTTPTFGVVVAVAGFPNDPSPFVSCGS